MDFGYPQSCEAKILKDVVTQEGNRLEVAPRPPIALTNAVSWRSEGKHSLTGLLTHALTCLLTHSLTHLLTYLLTHSLTYLLTHSLTHSLTYLLTYSLIHLLTRLLTYLLTLTYLLLLF